MSVKHFAFSLIAASSSHVTMAGVYTDDLTKCLVEATSIEDRTGLVKWMFTAASSHPAISSLSIVTQADRDSANQFMATLLIRLMTESCKDKAQ